MKIGVLALQGDFEDHRVALGRLGTDPVLVRTPDDLGGVDGLVIPGGESTTIGKLAVRRGLIEPIRARAASGMPVLGTCAGMILCARRVVDSDQPVLGLVDITVRRNAFGRQVDSFECDLDVGGVGRVRAVFIRAPWVESVGEGVEVLAERDGRPVAARQGRVLVTAFHPELTEDTGVHAAFLGV
ncbi:MAG: pyridoxal 5'-phosphate synthase glutaminase subunit PdxT [Acidobacteria bacterium]|nr:pyridoxal 5'-phosphate synthase glutaminase subunit PdxT [Acidobacteriota bacterium]